MKVISISLLFCTAPFIISKSKSKENYFDGYQGLIYNSFFPKKIFNLTLFEGNNCFIGHRLGKNMFSGMLGEMKKKKIDMAIINLRIDFGLDDFYFSPIIFESSAVYYYFFKFKFKLSNKSNLITTLKDLAEHSLIYPVLTKNGQLQSLFNSSKSKLNSIIWKKINKKGLSKTLITLKDNNVNTNLRLLKFIKDNNFAYIINKHNIDFIKLGYCSDFYQSIKEKDDYILNISQDFASNLNSMPYNSNIKKSLKKKLDNHFSYYLPFGFIEQAQRILPFNLKKNFVSKNSHCFEAEITLKFEKLNDPFYIQEFLNHKPLIKKNLTDGFINIYESTESGLRFSFRQTPFNDISLTDVQEIKIKLNLTDTKQKIVGFGGSFTDAACENLQKTNKEIRDQIIIDYFSENGLEYNLGRTTIGGSDFSSRNYTLDDYEYDYDLKNFSLTYEDLDYKIPIIKMALKHQPNLKLIATSWSPPIWLKTNKKIYGKGKLIGNKVTDKSYVTYAKYFVKFLDAYKKEGIKIDSITAANEPSNGNDPDWNFNCIGFKNDEMRDFIVKTLKPILEKAGYGKNELKFYIVDENIDNIKYYADTIMADPIAKEYVYGIAFHWYFNFYGDYDVLTELHEKYPNLELSSTEACNGFEKTEKAVIIGSWSRAVNYAKDIILDLNRWTSSWIDWNLVLDERGGPNWVDNFVDAPIIINLKTNTYIRQPMFYALAHFSKFLKKNYLALNYKIKSDANQTKNFYFSAFRNEKNEVVVVVNNNRDKNLKVSISLTNDKNNVFNILSLKNSIQTYVWKN
uniref:Glucosylceramidase n=1 Tax=Polyphagotarsonemus latus TaxID=1204166 RepID=A0AAN0LP79_9ACAR